jgi:hypothetical protein
MSVSVCPIATVNAPVERVWYLLSDPARYDLWWEAHTRAIVPEGPAQPGQTVHADLILGLEMTLVIERVDAGRHEIDFTSHIPLGITGHNHLTCTPLDPATCRVSFG